MTQRIPRVRVAAAADVHCDESTRAGVAAAFRELEGRADVLLLAGDLTTHGEPEQAHVLADACRDLPFPVVAVLGNHDWHADRAGEVVEVLGSAGITVLDRSWTVLALDGIEVGVVGTKGFVGGFPGSHLPDFGEPLLRRVYAETSGEVEAVERGLQAVAACAVRIVVLHYAPVEATLEGERRDIWTFLGTDRLASPIVRHAPDLVLHGHAHAGSPEGLIGATPVYNVAVPVIGSYHRLFELSPPTPSRGRSQAQA
jgi:Icc-related predicted phosphoesterase